MNILEKEIEQIVWENIDNPGILHERGLFVGSKQHYFQQLNLGSYGIADIVGVSFNHKENLISIEVIELKKDLVDANTLFQAIRYVRGLQVLFGKIDPDYFIDYDDIDIVLIGKSIQMNGDFSFAPNVFKTLDIYTYSIDLFRGVVFKNQDDYYITNGNLGSSFPAISEVFYKSKEGSLDGIETIEEVEEETDELDF